MNIFLQRRAEALKASAVLLCLLLGVPILLIVGVGWPLPKGMPSASETSAAMKTGAVSSATYLKAIALVLWLFWIQLVIGVALELGAVLRGRTARETILVPRPMRKLLSRVVSASLLMTLTVHQGATAMGSSPESYNEELLMPTAPVTELVKPWDFNHPETLDFSNAPEANIGFDQAQPDVTSADPVIHTVERRDSLRTLAELYLGDADRWEEVFILNKGQEQTVGGALSDPARLRSGWELVMPTDAHLPDIRQSDSEAITEVSSSLSSGQSPSGGEISVRQGETLGELAERYLGDADRWVDIFNSNRDIVQDPNVILPGWQLKLPYEVGLANRDPLGGADHLTMPPDGPSTEAASTGAFLPYLPEPDETSVAQSENWVEAPDTAALSIGDAVVAVASPTGNAPPGRGMQAALTVGGLGVFAASLGWALTRLRQAQRLHLPGSRRISPEAVRLEQRLSAAADIDGALFLDSALRAMAARIPAEAAPQIIGVSLSAETMSVFLDSPVEPVEGFSTSDNGTTWIMARSGAIKQLQEEANGVPAPLPALVTVGKKDGHEFLLNLEYINALDLKGEPEVARGLCSAMAVQLANSHLADDLTVICVGFGQDLNAYERVEYVPDLEAAFQRVAHQQRQNLALMGAPSPDPSAGLSGGGEIWPPTVVLVPDPPKKEDIDQLLNISGSSVCVAASGLEGARWSGRFNGDEFLLEPVGLYLEPHGVSEQAINKVVDLVVAHKDIQEVVIAVPQRMLEPEPKIEKGIEEGIEKAPAKNLELRVLGTVDVVGAQESFSSRRALDLVAYLAFHPNGADRDQLKTYIWPSDDPPSMSTFNNIVSRARKALGVNEDGKPYLPRVSPEGIYRMRPEVSTDVARFEALVSAAKDKPDREGCDLLRAALELVRGTPFTGGAGDFYRWADFGTRTHIECLIDETAHDLAERCVELGDFEGARWASLTGIRIVGICEVCYYWRLLAADSAGNPTEVRQVMAELVGVRRRESNLSDIKDLIGPQLLELHERLTTAHTVAG